MLLMRNARPDIRAIVRTASRRVDDVLLAQADRIIRARAGTEASRGEDTARGTIAPPLAVSSEPLPVAGDVPPIRAIPLSQSGVPRSLWLAIYAAVIVVPLVLARMSGHPGRSFVLELGSSLGIVALSLLALQLALPARLGVFAPLGADVAVRLHRRLADVLVAIVAAHVVVVILAAPDRLALVKFVGAPWRAQAAIGSVVALGALIATSIVRRRLRLGYALWRGIHSALGAGALVLAVAHTIGVDRYLMSPVSLPALGALTVTGLGGVVYVRLWRPGRLVRRPFLVEGVEQEADGVTTLQLRAHGHAGTPFRPGQFAWLKLGDERYGLAEHPFSYSSSADHPDRPSFTIRSQAGFSAAADLLHQGTQILVDGPHGAFRLPHRTRGLLLVAGGIGITPCMSILRTAADRGDRRRYLLLYGSRDVGQVVFARELSDLARVLSLEIVHVLGTAPTGWAGESGFVNGDLLHRRLPSDLRKWSAFICGPPPLVEGVMAGLAEVGLPADRVHAERFVGV